MADTSDARPVKAPDGADGRSRALRSICVLAALLTGACSGGGQSQMFDKPSWSLADKPPVSLGGPNGAAKAVAPSSPVYEYRGGRDPVTGTVRADAPTGPRLIEVRKGDTLHGLSLTYRVSVKALMDANNLTSTTIVPGRKLLIPAG